jgi:hypothetical protein
MRRTLSTIITLTALLCASTLLAQQTPASAPTAEAPPAAAPAAAAAPPAAAEAPPAAAPIVDLAAEHGGLTLEYAFAIAGKPATGKLERTPDGDLRVDLSMKDPNTRVPIKTSVIVLGGDPDTAFNLVHTTREMGRVTLPDPELADTDRYLFEALGEERIQNQLTHHIKLVDSKSGDAFELWLAPAAGKLGLISRMIRSIQKYQGSLKAAVAAHKLDGLPLKLKYTKRSTGTVTTGEVTTIAFGPVDQGRFTPPRGYRNTKMESLNPLEQKGGAIGGLKKMFKGFGRKR